SVTTVSDVVTPGLLRPRDDSDHLAPLGPPRAREAVLEGNPDDPLLHHGRWHRRKREDQPVFRHPALRQRRPPGDPEILAVPASARGSARGTGGRDRNLFLQHAS